MNKPEPQQEPMEWECKSGGLKPLSQRLYEMQPKNIQQHYTRIPPQQPRQWVGLTEEDRKDLWADGHSDYAIDAVEAKLKEKNT